MTAALAQLARFPGENFEIILTTIQSLTERLADLSAAKTLKVSSKIFLASAMLTIGGALLSVSMPLISTLLLGVGVVGALASIVYGVYLFYTNTALPTKMLTEISSLLRDLHITVMDLLNSQLEPHLQSHHTLGERRSVEGREQIFTRKALENFVYRPVGSTSLAPRDVAENRLASAFSMALYLSSTTTPSESNLPFLLLDRQRHMSMIHYLMEPYADLQATFETTLGSGFGSLEPPIKISLGYSLLLATIVATDPNENAHDQTDLKGVKMSLKAAKKAFEEECVFSYESAAFLRPLLDKMLKAKSLEEIWAAAALPPEHSQTIVEGLITLV